MPRFGPVFRVLGAVLAGMTLIACSRHAGAVSTKSNPTFANPGSPVQGDWVIQRIDSDIDTLNPLTEQTTNSQEMGTEIFEGLLHQNYYTL